MKILMVLDQEFPVDVRVENEAVALAGAGHQVHLACYTRKQLPENEVFRGITIHRVAIPEIVYKSGVASLTFPLYFRFWSKFLTQLVAEHDIEALHIHDLPLLKVGKDLKRKYNLKLIADLHENWPELLNVSVHTKTLLGRILSPVFLWKHYEKNILPNADRIIVVVEESAARLEKLGLDRSKISVVSNTLNSSEFGIPDIKPDPSFFTLYYAGGITYHRGLQVVLSAMAGISDRLPGIRLRIAGSGKYAGRLRKQISDLNLEEKVEFLGFLPLKDVAANLAIADAALIPHLKTGHTDSTIPHKLFQYMYANKPIIASNCAPLERIIKETGSGIIFTSGSAKDLGEKIIDLANDKIKILPAKKWVETKYNWHNDAEVLIETYKLLSLS